MPASFSVVSSPSPIPDPASAPSCVFPSDQAQWFRAEVLPHEAAVRGYLKHRYPAVDADDVLQESYVKVLRAQTTGPIRSAKALLFTVVQRTALSLLRRPKHYTEVPFSAEAASRVLDERPDASEVADARQRTEIVKAAIELLPARCQEIMRRAVLRGEAPDEIAMAMGIAESTVRAQLALGLKRCTAYMQQHGAML